MELAWALEFITMLMCKMPRNGNALMRFISFVAFGGFIGGANDTEIYCMRLGALQSR